MLKFILAFGFLFCLAPTFCQDKEIVEELNSMHGEERVSYLIKIARNKEISSKQAIEYIKEALTYAKSNNLHEKEIDVRAHYSILLHNMGDFSNGLRMAIEGFQLLEDYKLKRYNPQLLHSGMGLNLAGLGAYEASIEERKKALFYKNKFKDSLDFNFYFLKQQIAAFYLKIENIDSALAYFNMARKDAIKLDIPRLIAGSNNDIGLAYLQDGLKSKALDQFRKASDSYAGKQMIWSDSLLLGVIHGNIARCLSINDPNIQSHFDFFLEMIERYGNVAEKSDGYHHLAMYHEANGNYKKGIELALKTLKVVDDDKSSKPDLKLVAYMDLYHLYLKDNQPIKANFYIEKYIALYDKSYGKSAINDLLKTHSDYELSRIKQDLLIEKIQTKQRIENLNREKEISSLRVTILIIAIIFIVAFGLFFYLKLRGDAEKKRKAQELENRLLEIDNNKKEERLTQSVLSLQRKKDFSEQIIERIAELPSLDRKDLNSIKLYISNEVDIDESIIEMEKFISEAGKDFFIKLEELHPDLTDYEQRLIALIRMNLSIKQIAIIKNITPQSVKIAKNRLSKKLNLEPGSNIYDYLVSI